MCSALFRAIYPFKMMFIVWSDLYGVAKQTENEEAKKNARKTWNTFRLCVCRLPWNLATVFVRLCAVSYPLRNGGKLVDFLEIKHCFVAFALCSTFI